MAKLKDLSDFLEIVQEVKNMVATPDYVEKASEQIKAVYALTEEENLKHNQALATITEAKNIKAVLESLQKEHDEREAKIQPLELKLSAREKSLEINEGSYQARVKSLDDREAGLEKREKAIEIEREKITQSWVDIGEANVKLEDREADVKSREDKIASFANNIA